MNLETSGIRSELVHQFTAATGYAGGCTQREREDAHYERGRKDGLGQALEVVDACAQPELTDSILSTSVDEVMPTLPTELTHPESPADGLAAAVALRRLADRMEDVEVERALRDGWTWAQVAEALGVTRQAVHKKHARRLKDVRAIRP
jgi:hypothetical protein